MRVGNVSNSGRSRTAPTLQDDDIVQILPNGPLVLDFLVRFWTSLVHIRKKKQWFYLSHEIPNEQEPKLEQEHIKIP